MSPARGNMLAGKFDQRCFWAVSVQANSPVCFSASLSVPRKALAAAVMLAVASPSLAVGDAAGVDCANAVCQAAARANGAPARVTTTARRDNSRSNRGSIIRVMSILLTHKGEVVVAAGRIRNGGAAIGR